MKQTENKNPVPVELEDDALETVSGGLRVIGGIIPEQNDSGAHNDSTEWSLPIGAITEA